MLTERRQELISLPGMTMGLAGEFSLEGLVPVEDEGDRPTVILCGHLHNRQQLESELGLRSESLDEGDLVASAYRRWGPRCLDWLEGEFAFSLVVNDGPSLLLARDPLGTVPIYYTVIDMVLHYSSRLEALLERSQRLDIDSEVLQDYLHNEVEQWTCRTMYRHINRVPSGYALQARGRTIRLIHGAPLVRPQPRPRTDAGLIAAYRHALDVGVGQRLRGTGPVAVFTGGGVDSSALAVVTHAIAPERIRLVAATFDNTPDADESFYLGCLERSLGLTAIKVPCDDAVFLGEKHTAPEPRWTILYDLRDRLFRAAKDAGCRIALVGEGGDLLIAGATYPRLETITDVPLRQLRGELPFYTAWSGAGMARALVAGYGLAVMRGLPGARWVARYRRRCAARSPHALRQEHGNDVSLSPFPPGLRRIGRVPHLTATGRVLLETVCWPSTETFLREWVEQGMSHGIEVRFPYLDRRLLYLMATAPRRLLTWRGEDRILLRRAMPELPPDIRARHTKARFQDLLIRGVDRASLQRTLHEDSETGAAHLINGSAIAEAVEECARMRSAPPTLLKRAMTAHAWLRELEAPWIITRTE